MCSGSAAFHLFQHGQAILIDPHNEYGRSFEDRARILNPKNLKLPFWLFNLEEIVDVIFRARKGSEEEIGILAELIPIAKNNLAASRAANGFTTLRKNARGTGYTPDTPVPYRIEDLIGLINARMGKLENRSSWMQYHNLMTRIETVRNDPRYGFIFDNANVGGDSMPDVLSDIFRLPTNGKPMTLIQLAGFPSEVVDSIISVLGRMAFEFGLWSDGAAPILFVCEEAHRYAPADRSIGFGPTRKALSRIAKEGRKYGVFLSFDHAAPGGARSDHHLPVQHHLRHAARERPRPGHRQGRGLRRRLAAARIRVVARDARSLRLRGGRGAADAAAFHGTAPGIHPPRRGTGGRTADRGRRAQQGFPGQCRGPLARRQHEQRAETRRWLAPHGATGRDGCTGATPTPAASIPKPGAMASLAPPVGAMPRQSAPSFALRGR